jgi:hypothetical protein
MMDPQRRPQGRPYKPSAHDGRATRIHVDHKRDPIGIDVHTEHMDPVWEHKERQASSLASPNDGLCLASKHIPSEWTTPQIRLDTPIIQGLSA